MRWTFVLREISSSDGSTTFAGPHMSSAAREFFEALKSRRAVYGSFARSAVAPGGRPAHDRARTASESHELENEEVRSAARLSAPSASRHRIGSMGRPRRYLLADVFAGCGAMSRGF